MMAAFIVAIRGTLTQAVFLGLAATISHIAVVWVIALGGMYFAQRWNMQVASAVLMIGVAVWMMWKTWWQQSACFQYHGNGFFINFTVIFLSVLQNPFLQIFRFEHERHRAV